MPKITKEKDSILLFPVMLIVSILPLIMRLHGYDAHLAQYEWFSVDDHYTDCFLFYKASFFKILTGAMIIILALFTWKRKGKLKVSIHLLPLSAYLLMVFISTAFSVSSYQSLHGAYEQFESVFVLVGYAITAWFTFTFVNSEKEVRIILKYWIVGIILLCILGLFQFFKHDLYKTELFASLIAGPGGTFNVTAQPGKVYMSLYNPNYVGLYTSIAFPILAVLSIFSPEKRKKAGYASLTLALLICLYGSSSKNGIITVIIIILFFGTIFRNKIRTSKKGIVCTAAFLVLLSGFVFIYKGKGMIAQIQNAFSISWKEAPALENIRTTPDGVEIDYSGNTLYITFHTDAASPGDMLVLKDETNQVVETVQNPDDYTLTLMDPRFPGFYAAPIVIENVMFHNEKINRRINSFVVGMDQSEWIFTNQLENGEYNYITKAGKADKLQDRSYPFLRGYESLFSGRGFIWARTAPLLKKYILKGSGPDTFAIVFPNNDYVGRHNFGYADILVTRPHNLYLQIAVQTGLLSLVAFVVFYLLYFIDSLRLYWRNSFSSFLPQIGAAIMAGTTGFMISGLTNDSSITVSPIFWVMMGLGLAINKIIKKECLPLS